MNEPQSIEITPEMLEQNPVLALALSAMSLLVVALLVGSLASWIYLIVRVRRGQPLLDTEPCAPRVWGLADLAFVAVLIVGCQILLASLYAHFSKGELGDSTEGHASAAVAAFASLGNIVAIALALLWLGLRFNVTPQHVGFRFNDWWRQLQIGIIATLVVLPIVYLLMAAVSIGLHSEYKHPLLDEVRRNATLSSYLMGVVTAVLLAPLAEEFLFRVMIQGWLQSWSVSTPRQILLGAPLDGRRAERHAEGAEGPTGQSAEWDVEAEVVDSSNTCQSAPIDPGYGKACHANADRASNSTDLDKSYWVTTPPVWPSVVTGILFGLAHWGYGLSFIPLILLGVVLGLLYRATHSIWPCFIVHFALNGTSMLGLGLSILLERAQQ